MPQYKTRRAFASEYLFLHNGDYIAAAKCHVRERTKNLGLPWDQRGLEDCYWDDVYAVLDADPLFLKIDKQIDLPTANKEKRNTENQAIEAEVVDIESGAQLVLAQPLLSIETEQFKLDCYRSDTSTLDKAINRISDGIADILEVAADSLHSRGVAEGENMRMVGKLAAKQLQAEYVKGLVDAMAGNQ